MAFQYPAKKADFSGLMAMGKQYGATKEAHPRFGRKHSTFSNFAVRLSPLTTLRAGAMQDTCELAIDDQLGVVSRGAACRNGEERMKALNWQTMVSVLAAWLGAIAAWPCL